jgi:hypothetical protein
VADPRCNGHHDDDEEEEEEEKRAGLCCSRACVRRDLNARRLSGGRVTFERNLFLSEYNSDLDGCVSLKGVEERAATYRRSVTEPAAGYL